MTWRAQFLCASLTLAACGDRSTSAGGGTPEGGARDSSAAGDGAGDSGSCAPWAITFVLQGGVADGGALDCIDGDCIDGHYPFTGCDPDRWLTVRPATEGDALAISVPCNSCDGCGGDPATMGVRMWNGAVYDLSSNAAGGLLPPTSCAPAGHYIATMCGFVSSTLGSCTCSADTKCVDIPFDWPPLSDSTVVTGTL